MESLTLYIELQQLRFNKKLTYRTCIAPPILTGDYKVPSLSIQPFVENAIEHGIAHSEKKDSFVAVSAELQKGFLLYTIEDNGIGRQKAMELKSKQVLKKKSYGMQITADRIDIINRIQQMNASVLIEDLKDTAGNATGTKVIIEIPLQPLMA